MRKKLTALLSLLFLLLPFIAISIVYFTAKINVFNNPDFWYGYMAYFGTVALAAVSLWQNENANMINQRLADMSCKDKIAYLVPPKNQIIRGNTIEFRFFKRGNSFGFVSGYDLYINKDFSRHENCNYFFEETNINELQESINIEFQEKINRKEIEVCLVLYWKNQYGYEYKQNISMSYEQYKSRNDMYVSTKETFEIEYIK